MNEFFLHIYHFFKHRRKTLFVLTTIWFVSAVGVASQIGISENIAATGGIPARTQTALDSLSLERRLFIIVTDQTRQKRVKALSSVVQKIAREAQTLQPTFISDILWRVDQNTIEQLYDFVEKHPYFYLSKSSYDTINQATRTDSIRTAVSKGYRQLLLPGSSTFSSHFFRDPLRITELAMRRFSNLQKGRKTTLYNGFFVSKDHNTLIMFLTLSHPSNETGYNGFAVQKLKKIIASYSTDKVNIHLYGPAVIATENAAVIKRDILLTVSITVLLLIVGMALFFRRTYAILLLLLPAVTGGVTAIALLVPFKGTLSGIALGIGAMMLGITVDYALHLFTHFRSSESIESALHEVATPIITGAITTIGAFVSLFSISLDVLHDLALFSALSVFFSALFTLIVLPHILTSLPIAKHSKSNVAHKDIFLPRYPFLFLTILLVLSVGLVFFAVNLPFNEQLKQLGYMTPETRKAGKILTELTGEDDTLYFVSVDDKPESALAKSARVLPVLESMQQRGLITSFTAPALFIPPIDRQITDINRWTAFWHTQKIKKVISDISNECRLLHMKSEAFSPFFSLIQTAPRPLSFNQFSTIHHTLLRGMISQSAQQTAVTTRIRFPQKNKEKVVRSLRNSLYGTPIDSAMIVAEIIKQVKQDLPLFILLSLLLVFSVLWLFFHRIELAVTASIPIVLGWIWTLGLMNIFSLKLNIFNIVIVTFVFGLGIDFAIFILQGLLLRYRSGTKDIRSFRDSVLLSAATTLIGVGAMLFAHHPAILSIAKASVIAILTVTVITIIVEPILFFLLVTRRSRLKKPPLYTVNLLHSAASYLVYITMLTCGFIPFILIVFAPLKKTTKEEILHTLLMYYSRTVLGALTLRRRIVHTPPDFDPKKPVIFIANHASWMDIFYFLSLHPRIIMLVGDWVWKMPFIGRYARYAGFFTTAEGADIQTHIPYLAKKRDEGYSIVVFPEGTRTRDGNIHRFKKGAFFLSEQLNIPIRPVLIHGMFHLLPKKEMIQKEVVISSFILSEIAPNNIAYGTELRERAKLTRKMMQKEFDTIRRQLELPSFFRQTVFASVVYREPVFRKSFVRVEQMLPGIDKEIPSLARLEHVVIEDEFHGIAALFLALSLRTIPVKAILPDDETAEKLRLFECFPDNLTVTTVKEPNEEVTLSFTIKTG